MLALTLFALCVCVLAAERRVAVVTVNCHKDTAKTSNAGQTKEITTEAGKK